MQADFNGASASDGYVLGTAKWGSSLVFGTSGGVVTWSLVPGLTAIDPSYGIGSQATELSQLVYFGFVTELRAAFTQWSAISNISFIQVTDGGGVVGAGTFADIRILAAPLDGPDNAIAGTVMPDGTPVSGEIIFDTADASQLTSHEFFLTATHEIGHAIGLDHSLSPSALMYEFLDVSMNGVQADDIAGAQAIYGGAQPAAAKVYNLPTGQNTLTVVNGISGLTINGNNAGNTITGSFATETINGGTGNDTLSSGGGNDTLAGGAGNDTYVLGDFDATVVENPGEGNDTVIFTRDTIYTLPANVENITGSGMLTGNSLNNVITVTGGTNTLDGGLGADTMIGGSGNDKFFVDNVGDTVIEAANGGTDQVIAMLSYTAAPNVENIWAYVDNITATGNALNNRFDTSAQNVTLIGGAGDDYYNVANWDSSNTIIIENPGEGIDTIATLTMSTFILPSTIENMIMYGFATVIGNASDNTITNMGLANTLIGGAGNDTYVIGSLGATIVENSGEGIDTVLSDGSFVLSGNIENLTLTGIASTGTGNALANTIVGNANDNLLDGGAGADTLIGGLGNDTYVVDTLDTITENAGEGTDTVQSATTYVLTAANVENLTLTGSAAIDGTGNALANVITGNSAANTLDGGAGADTLAGGLGDDIYIVGAGDVVIEGIGQGMDTVRAGASYTLDDNVENLLLTGASAINGTGNGLSNIITGNAAANILLGGGGADTLSGDGGNDVINGGDGDDTFVASLSDGNDSYTGGNGWDILDCSAVGGVVQINQLAGITTGSAGNDTLLDVFEQIIGSNFGDVLSGGHGINCIDGMGGNDLIFGNNGDDLLRGGDGDDTFFFSANDGDDRMLGGNGWDILDYSNLAGVVQVNQLAGTTTGTANNDILLDTFEQVIGTAFGDVLSGGHGINSLNGGGGDDQIFANGGDDWVRGGAGNDTITLGPGNDVFSFWQGDGSDTVTDFVGGAGASDVIDLQFKPSVVNYAQVQAAMSQVGADTVINFGGGDIITLLNVNLAALHQDDFVFA